MFNDELLIGKFEVKLDKKNRFFIPARSKVEGGEQVIIKTSEFNDKKILKLMSYRVILEEVDKLKKKQETTSNSNDYLFYQNMIEELCFSFAYITDVDNQHRINLPKSLAEHIGVLPDEVMLIEGLGNAYAISKKS